MEMAAREKETGGAKEREIAAMSKNFLCLFQTIWPGGPARLGLAGTSAEHRAVQRGQSSRQTATRPSQVQLWMDRDIRRWRWAVTHIIDSVPKLGRPTRTDQNGKPGVSRSCRPS